LTTKRAIFVYLVRVERESLMTFHRSVSAFAVLHLSELEGFLSETN